MAMLVLHGAYLVGTWPPVFRRIAPPGEAERVLDWMHDHLYPSGMAVLGDLHSGVFVSTDNYAC